MKLLTNQPRLPPENGASRAQRAAVLPQWAFAALRPIVRSLSHVCWNLQLCGTENIPRRGGLIIASNHQTYIDPFWISLPINRPVRYLAWKEAFAWPLVGKAITLLGAWPLQLEGSDPAAIRRSLQWLREEGVLMIFPEGARSTADGSMMHLKAGAVRLALEAKVPILPVTIKGGNRVWPRNQRLPRLGTVEIIYHQPLQITPCDGEEMRNCARRETQTLSRIIESGLSDAGD